ncbi:MAG: protein-methionine-sulfoxide reductase heme-binding subunit MsrQ [Anaerolineae bacterium]
MTWTRTLRTRWLSFAVHLGALSQLGLLVWDFFNDGLTADPVRGAILRTGKIALVLLVLSLACTPVNTVLGFNQALKVRRALGLYAFFFACLHLFIFLVVDYGLDWGQLYDAVLDKAYALAGLAAFLLLIPLAVTSTKGWMRRLGPMWRTIHRWIYPASVLVAVHFIWLVKADISEPVLYAIAIALLLALRLPPVRRLIARIRGALIPRPAAIPRDKRLPE